jgi:hypothetical protein
MSTFFKTTAALSLVLLSSSLLAKDCPDVVAKYGDNKSYQDIFCKIKVMADETNADSSRSILFTDSGLIQVFNNFPGSKLSNSTGARVYYLFPTRIEKNVSAVDDAHMSVTHPSGVQFNFDKGGVMSSPDVKMKVSKEINSKNKSGVEIESYPNGIVIDLGYRIGNTPTLNKSAVVTITDKNKKKCTLENSEFNKIQRGEAELIYKTNEALHKFLTKRCPSLDISDLLHPKIDNFKVLSRPNTLGAAPQTTAAADLNDGTRSTKAPTPQDSIKKDENNGSEAK